MRQARWRSRRWIVDGHNLIFALPALCRLQMQGDRQRARWELEGLLLTFATRLEHPLIIVYDGNEFGSNPDAQRSHALETIYSQPPEEADDRIVYLATQAVARTETACVVTNDRSSLLPRLPAEVHVLSVEEFRTRHLLPEPAPEGPPEKQLTDAERHEIETLLLSRDQGDARRGARHREQQAIRRWRARIGGIRRSELDPAEEETGWRPPREQHHRSVDRAPAPRPVEPQPDDSEAAAARETKKERGQRQQKRRLEAQQRGTRRSKRGAKRRKRS